MGPRKKAKPLCECLGITEATVACAITEGGLTTLKQVAACTEAGSGCTVCHPAIRALLERRAKERALRGDVEAASPSSYAAASSAPIFSAK